MTADDVIDSYVRDVAACLPRGKRNDVAFELRALLADDLAGRAEAAGRAPDRAMAMALLKDFGRPAEVARRYHERPALIDPADTHHFVIWVIGGLVVLAVLEALSPDPIDVGDNFLKWTGLMTLFFALGGWWRRRNPNAFGWKPSRDSDWMPRPLALLAFAGTVIFPLAMYAAPTAFAEVLFLGVVPTSGLELTPEFAASDQRLATLILLTLSALGFLAVAIQGGYRPWISWPLGIVYVALGVLLVTHAAPMTDRSGAVFDVFVLPHANAVGGPFFGLAGAICILSGLYALWQAWSRISPAPRLKA